MSHFPTALDEYPIHQSPLPIARPEATDRNFYDRCYFNAIASEGDVMVVAGAGVYPNLGVQDAFLTVRRGANQHAARFSAALGDRPLTHRVGGFEVEVLTALEGLRLRCDTDTLSADLTWSGSFPAVLEQPHLMPGPLRPTLLAQRFAQLGTWSGTLCVEGETLQVGEGWHGTRDRSWGIRPVGDPDPAGRSADLPFDGMWWVYCPLAFDEFALLVILQETPDGHRTLNDASRVFTDGRIEQLGWPRVEIAYRSGTRHPERARLHLTTPAGEQLLLEVETRTSVALHVGAGYGGDPEWAHGQWRGESWSEVTSYDLNAPEVAGRLPWGVTDHAARARLVGPDGQESHGRGMFEHASMGRHDPSGFPDWMAVAP